MRVLIDVVLLLIIALCVWGGYKKGLIAGIGGVLAILVAVFGGSLLSGAYSGDVIPAFRPFLSGYVEGQVNDRVIDKLGLSGSQYSLEDIFAENAELQADYAAASFEAVGIYSRTSRQFASEAISHMQENGTDIKTAVSEVLCEKITYAVAFLLAFLLILIILIVIGNIPNLTYKIPNMDTLNNTGGLVVGVIRGLLLCSVLVWALKFMGALLGDALGHTLLARLLLRFNFLTAWIGV